MYNKKDALSKNCRNDVVIFTSQIINMRKVPTGHILQGFEVHSTLISNYCKFFTDFGKTLTFLQLILIFSSPQIDGKPLIC